MESDHPSELSTIWDEARINIEQGNFDKAIEIYKYILIMYPDEKVAVECANSYLGDVYLTLQEPKLAEGYIRLVRSKNDHGWRHRQSFRQNYFACDCFNQNLHGQRLVFIIRLLTISYDKITLTFQP